MSLLQRIINKFEPGDPDQMRRQRLLNIMLLGIFASSVAGVIYTSIYSLTGNLSPADQEGATLLLLASAAFLVLSIGLHFLNRRHGRLAAWVFLLAFTVILAFSDTPEQVANGRSLFVFSIPVAIAGLLIAPAAGFLFAGLSSLIITLIALSLQIAPNAPGIIGFFMLALVSWLAARSLEQALGDLRTINANLDRVVHERTRDLAESLMRERIEAGRSEAILNSIADGVIVFDRNGLSIAANPSLCRLLNMPREHALGRDFPSLVASGEFSPKARDEIADLLAGAEKQLANFRIEWGRQTLSVSAAPVRDNTGEEFGTVIVFRDITREAEAERMKSTFMGIVSHELRTPLNAILGYAEMLKESVYGAVNDKQAGAAGRIMSNTQRLLQIVNDLLDQAQIEAGRLAIRAHPLKPAELLENMHSVMDKLVTDKGIRLSSELDPQLPASLMGDAARLQQVLINLVNNAVKFTASGSIHVRLLRADSGHWALEVLDTGRGIPDEALAYIFDSFRQVEGAATREHGGIGLGLSIVKQLVQLMGGDIQVRSRVGVGSVFTAILPLVTPEEKAE